MEENLETNSEVNNEMADKNNKLNPDEIKEPIPKKVINTNEEAPNLQQKSVSNVNTNNVVNTPAKTIPKPKKVINTNEEAPNLQQKSVSNVDTSNEVNTPAKSIPKPKKELPVEKKPFQEFINIHLIPALTEEINQRGLEVININLKNTNRPIAGDTCWVINCEIKDTCSFWLSFEKEDISSLKSISLSKPNQEPSIIESFLIDEKKITLKLIISRVLQRLNGQKLIGVN